MITRRSGLMFLASMLVFGLASGSAAQPGPSEELAAFHQGLIERYPLVEHISTNALAALPQDSFLLFDVREPSEHSVSHLRSSIRVSPDTTAAEFLRAHGDKMAAKTVVFYCSVGERSSKLAQAVIQASDPAAPAADQIVNLEGGIFKWHNEARPVFDAAGATEAIHPFNWYWGRLLVRRDRIREN